MNPALTAQPHTPSLTVRLSADGDDADAVERLASLSGDEAPDGPVMLAEIDGEPVAAVAIADGRTVSDPNRSHAGVVRYLRLRRWETRLVFALFGG